MTTVVNPVTETSLSTGVRNCIEYIEYTVADLSLAEFGRKEIPVAEHEMPGVMPLRRDYAEVQPLKGARISGPLGTMVQTVARIHVTALGGHLAKLTKDQAEYMESASTARTSRKPAATEGGRR